MAITQNGVVAQDYATVEVSPILSIPFTVGAGSNRLLVVSYGGRSIAKSVASITFDGQSFTQGVAISGNTMDAEVWYLVAPNVTTAPVIITQPGGGVFVWSTAAVTCWNGVAQSALVDDTDTFTSVSSGNPSLSNLITTTDNCLIIDAIATNSGVPVMTAATNRVEQYNFATTVSNLGAAVSSLVPKTPAGAALMEWTFGAVQVSLVGIAFKPFVEPPADFSGGNPDNILVGQPRFGSGGPSIGMGF